ncbi:MAG TPA: Rmf/CrpP family protein [Rhizomicrobium sp.]|nr:Rmf/CrpP family protein [Rhizomicrobium sp.]
MRHSSRNRQILVAFTAGARTYRLGLPVSQCPSGADEAYKAAWERGWFDAQRKDKRSLRKVTRDLQQIRGDK